MVIGTAVQHKESANPAPWNDGLVGAQSLASNDLYSNSKCRQIQPNAEACPYPTPLYLGRHCPMSGILKGGTSHGQHFWDAFTRIESLDHAPKTLDYASKTLDYASKTRLRDVDSNPHLPRRLDLMIEGEFG